MTVAREVSAAREPCAVVGFITLTIGGNGVDFLLFPREITF